MRHLLSPERCFRRRFIESLDGYVAFAHAEGGLVKRIVMPHHCFAVRTAVGTTIGAVRGDGHAELVVTARTCLPTPTAAPSSPRP